MAGMVTRVDAALPVHALTVADVDAMVEAGILQENSHIELLDWRARRDEPTGSATRLRLAESHDAGRPGRGFRRPRA